MCSDGLAQNENAKLSSIQNRESISSDVLERQWISNGVKRKALDDVSERLAKLICRELDAAALHVLTGNDLQNLRKSVYRKRRTVYLPLPETLPELPTVIDNFDKCMKRGEGFLLVNDEDEHKSYFQFQKTCVTCSNVM